MKQKDWEQQLCDRLADYEEPAPADLWADIEARLVQQGAPAQQAGQKPRAKVVPLWVRLAVAAAFIGLLVGNIWLMQRISDDEAQPVVAGRSPVKASPPQSGVLQPLQEDEPALAVAGKWAPSVPMKWEKTETEEPLSPMDVELQPEPSDKPGSSGELLPSNNAQQPQHHPLPSQEEIIRQLDEKIAEASKPRRRIGFSLYAQNGLGSQMSANGVLMSPQLAANYDYGQYLISTKTRSESREPIYLVNYEERQKYYQPISFGLTANIPISSRLALTTGLVYTRLRSDFVAVMAGYPMTTEQTLKYVGVPLSAQYQMWHYKGLKVYASAGGQADYNVKAQGYMNGITQDARRDRWQFSVQGAVGVQYDVIPQLGVYVEPGVKHYFDNGSRVCNYFKDKPTGLNLQVGLRLNLGNKE